MPLEWATTFAGRVPEPPAVLSRRTNLRCLSSVSYVQAAGHRLEYKLLGAGAARARHASSGDPVLVFLHEGLGSVALWKSFPDRVAEAAGCAALVYSRCGYGRSDRLTEPRGVDYMHREALETLPQVLEALAIERPILIGHSDGASIAFLHAAAHPARAVVAMAPHVFVEDITVESIAQAKVAFETTDLAARLRRYHDDPVSTFCGWNDIWLSPEFRAWNIEAFLPRVAVPVLLIQGEDDQYGSVAQIEAIARQVAGPVQKLILPGCGHSPHVDRPEETVRAIADVVREVKGEGSEGGE